MIIKKYNDVNIEFYGVKFQEITTPSNDSDARVMYPLGNGHIHSFVLTTDIIPRRLHIMVIDPPIHGMDNYTYEIYLDYYKLHSPSKSTIEKYFEYITTFSNSSKTLEEAFPELAI